MIEISDPTVWRFGLLKSSDLFVAGYPQGVRALLAEALRLDGERVEFRQTGGDVVRLEIREATMVEINEVRAVLDARPPLAHYVLVERAPHPSA